MKNPDVDTFRVMFADRVWPEEAITVIVAGYEPVEKPAGLMLMKSDAPVSPVTVVAATGFCVVDNSAHDAEEFAV